MVRSQVRGIWETEVETDNSYAVLGLSPGATETEVKAAWRKLVSQWHPDRNQHPHAVGRIQRINTAFEQIRVSGFRPATRVTTGAARTPARGPARPADNPVAQDADAARAQARRAEAESTSARDAPGQAAAPAARAIGRRIRLTLEEAALGCTRELRGKVADVCTGCAGAGFCVLAGACESCAGQGSVRQRAWYGWMASLAECQACHGAGVNRQGCKQCGGTGKLPARSYKLGVRIPPGVRGGDVLFVGGAGQRSGPDAGDLNIRIEVANHEFFELDDDGTVRCQIAVHGYAWAAGRSINVPTLDGLRRLKLEHEQLLYRLPGLGFPTSRRGPRADCLVSIVPSFPASLSTDQDILLDQLIASTVASAGTDPASMRLSEWSRVQRAWEMTRNAPPYAGSS